MAVRESSAVETDPRPEPGVPEAPETPGDEAATAEAPGRSAVGTAHPAPQTSRAPRFYAVGFWRRSLGAFIDLVIILPISLLLGWLAGAITGVGLPPSRHRGLDFWLDLILAVDPAILGFSILTGTIAVIYLVVFQATMARTPGMILVRARIIDLYGDPPGALRCFWRTLGYAASVFTFGLGFIWVGFDAEKRGLHDWLAGTFVVKAQ